MDSWINSHRSENQLSNTGSYAYERAMLNAERRSYDRMASRNLGIIGDRRSDGDLHKTVENVKEEK